MLEVNPRSSRTVPFVAKSTGVPVARIAARAALGIPFSEQDLPEVRQDRVCVKAPVFPFIKLRGLDPAPGPEMKSTGEVFGSAPTADVAYLKARMATEIPIPVQGGVYLTVRDQDKQALIPIAQDLIDLGFNIHATRGTSDVLRNAGLEVNTVYRIKEPGSPDALDLMRTSLVQFIVNVPSNSGGAVLDGNMMRRLAVELNIPFVTTLSGARMEFLRYVPLEQASPNPCTSDRSEANWPGRSAGLTLQQGRSIHLDERRIRRGALAALDVRIDVVHDDPLDSLRGDAPLEPGSRSVLASTGSKLIERVMEEVVLITVHSIHDVGEISEDGVGTLDEDLGFGKGPACLLTQFLGNEASGALQEGLILELSHGSWPRSGAFDAYHPENGTKDH